METSQYIYHLVALPGDYVESYQKTHVLEHSDMKAYRKYVKSKEYKLARAASVVMRGSFLNKQDLINVIDRLPSTICEDYYTWIVIEKHFLNTIDSCVWCPPDAEQIWFKYEDGKYVQTERPECFANIVGWAGH